MRTMIRLFAVSLKLGSLTVAGQRINEILFHDGEKQAIARSSP